MKLRDVRVNYAPGMEEGIPKTLTFDDGFTFVVGPNASGKSTLARTMRLALWPQSTPPSIDAIVRASDDAGREQRLNLRGGQAYPAPLLDNASEHSASLYKLGLKDLLQTDNRADKDFAQRLQTELYGGVPVAALRVELSERTKEKRAERTALRNAREGVRNASTLHLRFQQHEKELQKLGDALEDATSAQQRVEALDVLLKAHKKSMERREIDTELRALPSDLEKLREDDLETQRALSNRLENATRALRDAEATVAEVRDEISAIEPAWKALDDIALADGQERYEAVQKQQREADDADFVKLRKNEQLLAARAAVLGEVGSHPVSNAQKQELKDTLDALRRAEATMHAHSELLATLETTEHVPAASEDALRARSGLLRAWLRMPASDAMIEATKGYGLLALVTLLSVFGTVIWWTELPTNSLTWHVGVVLLTIVACVLSIVFGYRRRMAIQQAQREQEKHQQRAKDAGIELSEWTVRTVGEALRKTEDALRDKRRAVQIAALRTSYTQKLRDAEASVHAQRDALKTLLQGLGIRSDVLTLEVAEIFARTEKWIDAEAVHSESIANYKHAQRSLADAESSWEAWVEAHELTTQEHAKGRKNLLAYARKNLQDFQSLQQDLKHAQTTLVREQTQHDEVQAAYTELTERLGEWADSEAALEHALEQWEARQGLLSEQAVSERELATVRQELQDVRDELNAADIDWSPTQNMELQNLLDIPERRVEAQRQTLRIQAEGRDDLYQKISEIRAELRQAQEGHTIEDAYAAVARAEEESRVQAQSRADALLETLVLDWSIDPEDADSNAENTENALDEANAWLLRFTHGQYALRVSPEGELLGLAVQDNQPRSLDALSDATRVQTLLAARLAAIQSAEAGGPQLPLILDEVFSTTDPVRFEAIAHALSQLVSSGRQVVYFTADPGEWQRWQALHQENGTLAKAHVQFLTDRDDNTRTTSGVALPSFIPAEKPVSRDPSTWAKALNLAEPTAHTSAEAWPLLWLLPDHLDAVYNAYTKRIEAAGPAVQMTGMLADKDLWGLAPDSAQGVSQRLQRRLPMLHAVLKRFRAGQSGRLRWDDVLASGNVSDTFADRIYAVFEETHADPLRFIEAVAEVSRYQKTQQDGLREHLEDQGILPTQAPADAPTLLKVAVDSVDGYDDADIAWIQSLIATLPPSKAEG